LNFIPPIIFLHFPSIPRYFSCMEIYFREFLKKEKPTANGAHPSLTLLSSAGLRLVEQGGKHCGSDRAGNKNSGILTAPGPKLLTPPRCIFLAECRLPHLTFLSLPIGDCRATIPIIQCTHFRLSSSGESRCHGCVSFQVERHHVAGRSSRPLLHFTSCACYWSTVVVAAIELTGPSLAI
jgi:hypothetical protein